MREVTYEIWQLVQNERFPNLQSWVRRRKLACVPSEFNTAKTTLQDVQENLERIFCKEGCLHKYKIKSSNCSMQSPDIFDTKRVG